VPDPHTSVPPSYPAASALHPSGDEECDDSGHACSQTLDCDGSFVAGPLPPPSWPSGGPGECQSGARHERLEYLDDCIGNSMSPIECGASSGDAICTGGYVTTYCTSSSECPDGMVCANDDSSGEFTPSYANAPFGECLKTCDPAGSRTQCIRCELACQENGICTLYQEPPHEL
jgi:hypothetical protein